MLKCMTGGSWAGEDSDDFVDISDFLKLKAKNGVIIDGILVWIDIQQKETAPNLWQAQANEYFSELEVLDAKKALWKTCEKHVGIIGPVVNRKVDKKKATIDDIGKALLKLKENEVLPLLLGSSDMMKRAPCFNTCPSSADSSDVLARVKVLEDSLSSYMKLQTDEMKKLTHAVGALVPPQAPVGALVPPQAPPGGPRPRLDSVAKKHKLDDDNDIEEVFVDSRDNNAWNKNVNQNKQIKTFASIVQNGPRRHPTTGNMNNQSTENNFRPRKQSTLLFGNAKTGKDNTENYLAANVNLVATGVAKDATADQLKEFIVTKGIPVVDIELLTSHPEARTNTYRIAIKASDFDRAMCPDVWPYRVGVRMFKHKRNQNNWSSQAGQTGGNIQHGAGLQGGQPGHHIAQRYPQYHQQQQQRHSVIETSNQFSVLNTELARQFDN